ncbi:MAG TPA: hypothetical protein VLY83_05110 [Methanoregula sp.]|nr:hypothetical protein [Methanoregula sp.]
MAKKRKSLAKAGAGPAEAGKLPAGTTGMPRIPKNGEILRGFSALGRSLAGLRDRTRNYLTGKAKA